MERYHVYKLGLAIVFYMIYSENKLVANGLKNFDIARTLSKTDYRARRDAEDFRKSNVDFPTYSHVPRTKFSCTDMEAGYYADIETGCQVFHICDEGRKLSFLCPNGTVFQQGELICDWWFKVNCTTAPLLYEESAEILQRENAKRKSHRRTHQTSREYGSSTTESFQRKYTSRGDRKLDSVTYDTNINKIDELRTRKPIVQYKFQPSPNPPPDFAIDFRANNKLLPLHSVDPRDKVRFSSYGNSVKDSSAETQEVQETASFVTNSRNRLPVTRKVYPNHRETYSDIQDPRHYYRHRSKLPEKPFRGSSVNPQVLSTVPVSSNYGKFTTESNRQDDEARFSFNFKSNEAKINRIEKAGVLQTTSIPTTTSRSNHNYNIVERVKEVNNISLATKPDVILLPPLLSQNTKHTTTLKPLLITTEATTAETETETAFTTTIKPTTTEISTTGFISSTILQPKPFSLNSNTFSSTRATSMSPFIIRVHSPEPLELSLPIPTEPTPFNAGTVTKSTVEENVNNMLETLMTLINQRYNLENDPNTPRPGLIIPPSVGPQTLHTLAVYFANTLENVTSNSTEQSSTISSAMKNEEVIKDLLTQMTRSNYDNLFKQTESTTASSVDDRENDLIKETTNNLISDVPNVRVLARVFTEALSAYLEDPETFKKVLYEVRPTEPTNLQNETTDTDEDEVLNYSDSDLKSDHPYLHTPTTDSSISPTWGYILALNTTPPVDFSKNLLTPDAENLQSADSQSFVSQLNKIMQELKGSPDPVEVNALSALPKNHWTTSKDVEKLWQNTLSINPLDVNENFDTETADISTDSEENSNESLLSEVHYDLRALPKIELNSTQVHGILIDFMRTNKTQGAEKLQRLLNKLNITENQFLEKMKEVEGNPLTRRLVLLLINECSSNSQEEVEPRALSIVRNSEEINTQSSPSETIFKSADSKLQEEDEDTRALQLLNSLYVIASKFGK